MEDRVGITYVGRRGSILSCRGGKSGRTAYDVLADFTWPFGRVDGLSEDWLPAALGRLLTKKNKTDPVLTFNNRTGSDTFMLVALYTLRTYVVSKSLILFIKQIISDHSCNQCCMCAR